MNNWLDRTLVPLYNQFANRAPFFDKLMLELTHNHFLKGGVLMTLAWWLWFRERDPERERRVRNVLIANFAATVVVLTLMRILVKVLPFRKRPIFDEGFLWLADLRASRLTPGDLDNSFPSDHAALFVCLAVGLWLVNRRVGFLALLYVLVFICFPRVYVGYHYPTDIVAGALIGAAGALLAHLLAVKIAAFWARLDKIRTWAATRPAVFYPCFLFFSFEIMELFESVRSMTRFTGALRSLGWIS